MNNRLELYSRLLGQKRISRRDFMARAAVLGVSPALASMLAARTTTAATPKKGGTLRVGLGQGATTDSLDPATYSHNYMLFVGFAIFNYLTEVSNTGELIPELAEDWDVSADATTWTFKLRRGIEFHNGKPVDVDDVLASINYHMGPDTKSPAKVYFNTLTEIRKASNDSIAFKLSAGNADFPFLLSDYHLPILPAKDGKVDWQSGIGTGGYTLESFEPGIRTTMIRNPNYWKEGRAHFDDIEALVILDTSARTNALMSGEIDVMDRVDLKTIHLLTRNENIRVEQTPGALHFTFPMLTDTPPFDDNDVRLACKYAVDREALLKSILQGYGILGNDHPISPANRFFASELPQRHYDPDKAKFHLRKAGYESLKVDLSAAEAAYPSAVDAAVLYKEHAAPAGIDINVVREPNDGYWSNVWMKKPWCAGFWTNRPTEDWMFSTVYAEGASWNDTHWTNDKFNKLLKEARGELDQSKRREMYVEMQGLVRDDGGAVIPIFGNWVFAIANKVQHEDEMAYNWDLDGERAAERWWFE